MLCVSALAQQRNLAANPGSIENQCHLQWGLTFYERVVLHATLFPYRQRKTARTGLYEKEKAGKAVFKEKDRHKWKENKVQEIA